MAGSRTSARARAAVLGLALGALAASAGGAEARRPALRFAGRLQVLSGAAFTLLGDGAGERSFSAYIPLDVEIGLRIGGPLSMGLGGAGYAAPVAAPACAEASGRRPHGLAAFGAVRLDFNNSRDGSWLSPWIAIRAGLAGQDAVAALAPGSTPAALGCSERLVLGAFLSPRAGLDLWLGPAAVTFAVGYDVLPRSHAVAAQLGLTLRLL